MEQVQYLVELIKTLAIEERDKFLKGADPMNIDKMIEWALGALELFKGYHKENKDFIDNFAVFPSNHLSLVRKDGAMDLYHGVLRAVDKDGKKILNDVDYQEYYKYIDEEVKSWSYMKFPFLTSIGKERRMVHCWSTCSFKYLRFYPYSTCTERI